MRKLLSICSGIMLLSICSNVFAQPMPVSQNPQVQGPTTRTKLILTDGSGVVYEILDAKGNVVNGQFMGKAQLQQQLTQAQSMVLDLQDSIAKIQAIPSPSPTK